MDKKTLEHILHDIESDENLKGAKNFVTNFFLSVAPHPLEVSYANYLMDLLLYSPTNKAIQDNWLYLCHSFSKITQTSIWDLMELERGFHNTIFTEQIDEQALSHYKHPGIIYNYTAKDAVRDGIFHALGRFAFHPIYFTSGLWNEGLEDDDKREKLIERGIELLTQRETEDTEYLKLRVIEKNKIWVTQKYGGITFMKPSDY